MPPNPPPDTSAIDAQTASTNASTEATNAKTEAEAKNAIQAQANVKAQQDYARSITDSTNESLKNILATDNSRLAFDLVAQSILGAGDSFKNFNSAMGNTQSFSAQTASMLDLVKTGHLAGDAMGVVAKAMGLPQAAINKGGPALEKLVTNFAAGADQALKFQTGFVGMMGTSGGLDQFFTNAGSGLENLNSMMFTQRDALVSLSGATGATVEQIAPLYEMMGKDLPGALGNNATAAEKTAQSMSDLKDVMQLASGTGRDSKEVITSMKTAWETYGLSGQEALKFTSRMSELNQKFGINLEYTKKFIDDNAMAFKRISTNADDGAKSFNRWFDALKGTGLSAKESSAMIGEMTGQMSKLSTAQKAFLSAQSGGPGGLRGAAKIEGLLKEGKEDEVLKMVETTLKKQFGGKITTLADAQKSEEAAGQYFKQKQMLQSGAFGGLAKDDATAARLLEAMKAGTSGKEALTADAGLKDSLKHGDDLQKTSNTLLSTMVNIGQRQLAISSQSSLETIQKLTGGRNNEKGVGTTPGISQKVDAYREKSGKGLDESSSKIMANQNTDENNVRTENIKSGIELLPDSLKTMLARIMPESKSSKPKETVNETSNMARLGPSPSPAAYTDMGNRYTSRALATGTAVNQSVGTAKTPAWLEAYNPAGQDQGSNVSGQRLPPPPSNTKVDVTVKGLCLKCARPMQSDPTTVAVKGGT